MFSNPIVRTVIGILAIGVFGWLVIKAYGYVSAKVTALPKA